MLISRTVILKMFRAKKIAAPFAYVLAKKAFRKTFPPFLYINVGIMY